MNAIRLTTECPQLGHQFFPRWIERFLPNRLAVIRLSLKVNLKTPLPHNRSLPGPTCMGLPFFRDIQLAFYLDYRFSPAFLRRSADGDGGRLLRCAACAALIPSFP